MAAVLIDLQHVKKCFQVMMVQARAQQQQHHRATAGVGAATAAVH